VIHEIPFSNGERIPDPHDCPPNVIINRWWELWTLGGNTTTYTHKDNLFVL